MGKNEIVVYQPSKTVRMEVLLRQDTVWLNRQQLAQLFGRDIKTIMAFSKPTRRGWNPRPTTSPMARCVDGRGRIPAAPFDGFGITTIDTTVYHIGASLKDLGRSLFAFSKLVTPAATILAQLP